MTIDSKINLLLKTVKEQQEEVAKTEKKSKTSWNTTCSYNMANGKIVNIQICKEDKVIDVMTDLIREKTLRDQAYKALDLDHTLEDHNGFSIDDWTEDLKKRLASLRLKNQKEKLTILEKRLNNILSEEQKRELELEDIMKDMD